MIDWVTFEGACEAHQPIGGGRVASFDADGAMEWSVNKRLEVEGTGSSRIQIRSLTAESYELTGNLTKFFQGHNVFGTSDLRGLIEAWDAFAFTRGFPLLLGLPRLRRVDVNVTYRMNNQVEVLEWLRWAAQTAHLRHRGRGTMFKEGTVYWGQGSRRSSLKAYSKHDEVVSTGKAKTGSPLYEVTKGLVRIEATIRGMELKRMGLENLTEWLPQTANMVVMKLLDKLTLPERLPSESLLDVLPQHLKAPYAEWMHGRDPRSRYARATAYRYRRALLEHGVDIFVPPSEPTTVGRHEEIDMRCWDVRKLKPWQPSTEDITRLGYFEPDSYRPAHTA